MWRPAYDESAATGHNSLSEPQDKRKPSEANAAASLHTTAEEYGSFLAAVLEGRGLSSASARLMGAAEVQFSGKEPPSQNKPPEVWDSLGWGLGWGVRGSSQGSSQGSLIWHWGDNGPFKAFVVGSPRTGVGVVYFANSTNGLAIIDAVAGALDLPLGRLMEWLGYERFDAPGRAERRAGERLASEGRYDEALDAFEQALSADPDNRVLERRIDWTRDLVRVTDEPVRVTAERLARYAGDYGPRRLLLVGNALYYQREGNPRYRLIALSQDTFAVDGLDDFRIRVESNADGAPLRIVGLYLAGNQDA